VRLDPQNAQALFSLGVAFEAKGDFAQAKSSYQLAHVLEPENKDYIEALAAIDKKSAQSEQLVHGQSQLRQLADDAASAYQRGEYLSALDLYRQLDEQDPNQALVKWNIGSLYLTIKNAKMALKYYKEAVKLKPDDDRYKQTLKRLEEEIHAQAAKERETGASSDTSSQPGAGQIDKRQEKKQREHQAKAQSKNNPVDLLLQYGITAKHSKDGAHIIAIGQNSRAAQVGLKEDDLIKAVDGAVTTSGEQINRILLSKPTGARFQFTVQRGARLGQILF
jgi:tetratricopeptide (TPR) repeat protein